MIPHFFVIMMFLPVFGGPVRITTQAASAEACQEYVAEAVKSLRRHRYEMSACGAGAGEDGMIKEATRLVIVDADRAGRRVIVTVELTSAESCQRARRVAVRLSSAAAVISEC